MSRFLECTARFNQPIFLISDFIEQKAQLIYSSLNEVFVVLLLKAL